MITLESTCIKERQLNMILPQRFTVCYRELFVDRCGLSVNIDPIRILWRTITMTQLNPIFPTRRAKLIDSPVTDRNDLPIQ